MELIYGISRIAVHGTSRHDAGVPRQGEGRGGGGQEGQGDPGGGEKAKRRAGHVQCKCSGGGRSAGCKGCRQAKD